LLEATVRVIGRGGIAAVDHRAVAAEAGVPLGSTTYYFTSKDDMIAQALEHVADREAARIETQLQDGLLDEPPAALTGRLADAVVDIWADDSTVLLALFELYLESARRPDLRPAAERWERAYRSFIRGALEQLGVAEPEHRARLLCAGLDGLLLNHVAAGGSLDDLRAQAVDLICRIAER
jgi:DNA-binding transcriptional regulator YbjK